MGEVEKWENLNRVFGGILELLNRVREEKKKRVLGERDFMV